MGNCHGTGGTVPLKFQTPLGGPVPVYANFIILESYPAKAGSLLDHRSPKDSLLASYTLPADQVPTGRAHSSTIPVVFKSSEEPGYKALLTWLGELPVEAPDYGINLPEWPVPSPTPTVQTRPTVP